MKVAVIGGGIAGLTAAYRLIERSIKENGPIEVVLYEGNDRVGGIISTEYRDGAVVEHGPDAFITTKPEALELCNELGLTDSLIKTNDKFRRAFVAFGGKLHPMPEGFVMLAPSQLIPLMQSSLFSPMGKLRMMMDVIIPRKVGNDDESLADFVRRRLGQEALERVAQPMMAGVYTADPEKLSLRSTMPQFLKYESDHGSVIVGLQEEAKKKSARETKDGGARYSIFVTPDKGMGALVGELAKRIGSERIKLNHRVTRLESESSGWLIEFDNGERERADAVIMAMPSLQAARLLKGIDGSLSEAVGSIRYASSIVLNLLFKREQIPNPLDGFGFVVPAIEKRNIIACSYSSIKFANRAPEGFVMLRAFVGGALRAELNQLSEDECIKLALNDLRHYLGIKSAPVWCKLSRCPTRCRNTTWDTFRWWKK